MKTSIWSLLKPVFFALIVCIGLTGGARISSAAGNVIMPCRYRNAVGGATIHLNITFNNVLYNAAGAYCADNHRDPDGNKYEHGHLTDIFAPAGFTAGPDTVTAGKSDWAWNAYYTSYTFVSGSTFALNCYSYAVGSPTVTFQPGWEAFTNASTQCENTAQGKSQGDGGHCIKFTTVNCGTDPCVIDYTIEKNASGGVYEHGWLPVGTAVDAGKAVRKLK
jgi:hypothetical protein